MRLFFIILYFILLGLAVIFLRLNREINYIIYCLLLIYFFLILTRVFYPWFFGFLEISKIIFLILVLFLVAFLRIIYFSEIFYIFIKSFFSFKSETGVLKNFAKILETKEILFRKIPRNWIFLCFYFFCNLLSKISSKFLIFLFFLPSLLFVIFFLWETLYFDSYFLSFYLFSIMLLWQRLYPRFLEFFLGFGNLFFVFKELVDKKGNLEEDFLKYSEEFFDKVLEIYSAFCQGAWILRCFNYFPNPENFHLAENFAIEARDLYLNYFFPARNWFIFVRVLLALKRRLLSLYFILFIFTFYFLYFLPFNIISINSNFYCFIIFFSYIIFCWFLKNFSLFKYLAMPINTASFYFFFTVMPKFSNLFNNFYNSAQRYESSKRGD